MRLVLAAVIYIGALLLGVVLDDELSSTAASVIGLSACTVTLILLTPWLVRRRERR